MPQKAMFLRYNLQQIYQGILGTLTLISTGTKTNHDHSLNPTGSFKWTIQLPTSVHLLSFYNFLHYVFSRPYKYHGTTY